MALGLSVLHAIGKLPRPLVPFALASFVSVSVVGAFTWGMWQAWFMAAFAFAAVFAVLVLQLARRRLAA